MKWEAGKTYTWKDSTAQIGFITNGGGCLSPLNEDISKAIGDKPFTIIKVEDNGWVVVIELDGVEHTAKTATGKDMWTATYFFSPFDIKYFREVEAVSPKWEVGKTYTWKNSNAKVMFSLDATINRKIAEWIGDETFTVSSVDSVGIVTMIDVNNDNACGTFNPHSAGVDDDVDAVWFVGRERKYFREVEAVKEPEDKVTTDSKVIGQLKRLFNSRYGLTMIKFGEANEGKRFEHFEDFIAALDKMDEIMQDRQKIKDLQEDIKRREVEFLIGRERGW